jgi:hypothetical protein
LLSLAPCAFASSRSAHSAPSISGAQNTASAAAPSKSSASARTNAHSRPDSQQATGVITDSDCDSGWKLQLETPSGKIHLAAPENAHITILDPSGKASSALHCADLKGKHLVAHFKANATGDAATIEQLQLLDSGEGPNAGPLPANSAAEPARDTDVIAHGASNPAVKGLAGDQLTGEGNVTAVTCNGNELFVTMTVANGQLTLHSRNYAHVTIDDDRTTFENQDFPACTGLKGRRVSIMYVVSENRPYDGEIQSVEIEK